ncbi:hypothetical protein ACFCZR_24870 [Streptomyces rubiginosohelvolus]|uniref:hypothetical protein n=1 Tax=Streptomyces rubiginosohelvolus TaxID=67362 RepID=UPI0035DC6D60
MPEESFAARNATLINQVVRARRAGDEQAAARALEELLAQYTRLGQRLTGTDEEQNAYIVARRLGALPAALTELGVREKDLPPPAARRPTVPPVVDATEDDAEARVVRRFASLRAEDSERPARFRVDYRPQDNMRHHGTPLPYAVVDDQDGLPVGWYPDSDWADLVAGTATRLREAS